MRTRGIPVLREWRVGPRRYPPYRFGGRGAVASFVHRFSEPIDPVSRFSFLDEAQLRATREGSRRQIVTGHPNVTRTTHTRLTRFGCSLLSSALLFSLLGCQSTSYPPPPEQEFSFPSRVGLGAGDVIEVKFFRTPELNELQTVRPDNKISLQLIGEIDVEGKSPAELRRELIELYDPILHSPDITVLLRSFESQKVFVGGQVNTPGRIALNGSVTALEAIMEAGGFNMLLAEPSNVIVIRNRGSQRYGYSLDLRSALNGEPRQPFYLEPRDIIYVPRTNISKLTQWIDQHINQIIPQSGFLFSTPVGESTIGVDTSAR